MSPPCGLEDQRLLQKYSYFLCQKLFLLVFRISSSSSLRSFNPSIPTTTTPAAVTPGCRRLFSAPLDPSSRLLSPLDFTSHYQNRCRRTECPFSVAETPPPRSPYPVIYLPGRAVDVNPPHVLATRRGQRRYLVSAERRRGEIEWDSLLLALSVCALSLSLSLECHLICGRAPHSGSSNFLPFPPTPRPLPHR